VGSGFQPAMVRARSRLRHVSDQGKQSAQLDGEKDGYSEPLRTIIGRF
jgi:hypothetical protein